MTGGHRHLTSSLSERSLFSPLFLEKCLTSEEELSILFPCGWACSSVGQSVRLITGRSQVRTLSGPPLPDNSRPSVSRVAAGASICRKAAYGDVAQLGERGLCKPEAEGSSPFISTRTHGGTLRGALVVWYIVSCLYQSALGIVNAHL